MCKNINKTQSICKGAARRQLLLLSIGMVMLSANNCIKSFSPFILKRSKKQSFVPLKRPDATCSYLKDDMTHLLGGVNYLKRDAQIGLIQLDPKSQSLKGKKTGILFYAPRTLNDCSSIHLSSQGATLSYLDGSSQVLSVIEIDKILFDQLWKETEPLYKRDRNILEATCTTDFIIFPDLDYGIPLPCASGNGMIDQKSLQNIDDIALSYTKYPITGTNRIVQLVKYLSTNKLESRKSVSGTSFDGNRLETTSKGFSGPAYAYIKSGNRYRLIPWPNTEPAGKGCQCSEYRNEIRQMIQISPKPQEIVTVADAPQKAKNSKKTVDMKIQTEDLILPEESDHNNDDGQFVDDDFFDVSKYYDGLYASDLACRRNNIDGNDQVYHLTKFDLDEASDKENSCADSGLCNEDEKEDSENNSDQEVADHTADLLDLNSPRTPTKLKYKLVFSNRDKKKINKLN